MFEYATARLLKASLVCGAVTMLFLALPAALKGGFMLAPAFVIAIPLVALFYALGLAFCGVPLLWLWPAAFKRGVARGLAATVIGAATVAAGVLVLSVDFRSLPKLRFEPGNPESVVLLMICGAIAGFVWWWLNFDAAPDDASGSA
jgi:hypothetical protein